MVHTTDSVAEDGQYLIKRLVKSLEVPISFHGLDLLIRSFELEMVAENGVEPLDSEENKSEHDSSDSFADYNSEEEKQRGQFKIDLTIINEVNEEGSLAQEREAENDVPP
jgi:hypothetical protein